MADTIRMSGMDNSASKPAIARPLAGLLSSSVPNTRTPTAIIANRTPKSIFMNKVYNNDNQNKKHPAFTGCLMS